MTTSEKKPKTTKSSVGSVDVSLSNNAAVTNAQVLEKQFLFAESAPWHTEVYSLSEDGFVDILPPPPSLFQADEIIDGCPSLAKNIACMVTNVAGHGFHLKPEIEVTEQMSTLVFDSMNKEKERLESFFKNLCVEYSFTELMELLVTHLERYANAYWEILRGPDGRVVGVSPIENPKKMRLCKKGAPSFYKKRTRVGQTYESINTQRRFRRFVLLDAGGQKRYFRQYGDARQLNSKTGKYGDYQTVPHDCRANEIMHFRLPHSNSEYGVVRWISALVDAMIARVAKLCNLDVLDNGGTPPMAIAISGTSDNTLEQKIRDQIRDLKEKGARSKVLIIQVAAEEAGVAASETVMQPKISFENLAQMMISEGMFLDQLKYSDKEICSVYRIPPLLLGDLEQVPNKATASVAKSLAEEQVFAPARKKIEENLARLLEDDIIPDRAERGVLYWRFEFNAMNSDETDRVLDVLKEAREGGSITVNQHNNIIRTLLPDHKIEALADDERNDMPMLYLKKTQESPFQMLMGKQVELTKQVLSKALGKQVNKIMLYEPEDNDFDPYSPEAA